MYVGTPRKATKKDNRSIKFFKVLGYRVNMKIQLYFCILTTNHQN